MKRIGAFILACILAVGLVACGESDNTTSSEESTSSSTSAKATVSESTSTTSEEEKIEISDFTTDLGNKFSLPTNDTTLIKFTAKIDSNKILAEDDVKLMIERNSETSYFFMVDNGQDGDEVAHDGIYTYCLYTGLDTPQTVTVWVSVKDEVTSDENVIIEIYQSSDFFSDEERQAQFTNLYESYQYTALYDYVNAYIAEGNTSTDDNAYAILDIITPLKDRENTWIVSFDDFEQKYTVTFQGANGISTTCAVDASTSETSSTIKLGFQKDDWLFFDNYTIRLNGEYFHGASVKIYDREDTVIGDGLIEEYVVINLSESTAEQLANVEPGSLIVRFSDSDNETYYDHTFTADEINGLYCCVMLQTAYRDLANLLYNYNQNN